MPNYRKPIPKSQKEISNNQVEPYVDPQTGETRGNPNSPQDYNQFSSNSQKGVDFNRSEKMSFKGDTVKPFTVSIQDVDEAILYYFENIIKPTVIQNGERISVPLIYGSPERFSAVQKDGFYRDKKGKVMSPLIMFKRDSLEKNRNITTKLDSNNPHLYTSWQKTYNPKNAYSNFEVLNNRIPTKQFIANVVPDYVTLTYSFIIQTYYIEQLNKVVEAINYASDSYWGDPERFKFKSRIDTFNTITELNQGKDRIVRSNFTLNVQGYIIPDIIQSIPQEMIIYLNTNVQRLGSVVDTITATFPYGWLGAPTGLPATSIENFTLFCNGVLIEKVAIVSFTVLSGVTTLIIDPAELGYTFLPGDEVIAIGKFSS